MTEQIVVCVFSARGEATNARHRLEHEGVPAADIAVRCARSEEEAKEHRDIVNLFAPLRLDVIELPQDAKLAARCEP